MTNDFIKKVIDKIPSTYDRPMTLEERCHLYLKQSRARNIMYERDMDIEDIYYFEREMRELAHKIATDSIYFIELISKINSDE